jgi:protein-tyrosine phosphatase
MRLRKFLSFRAYGGKRAMLRSILYGTIAILGGARRYRKIDWMRVDRVVFVCHGNICRSPFAEAVAKKRGLQATSLGLFAENGVPADPDATKTAAELGVDLGFHRATRASDFRPTPHDLVVGFEPAHVEDLMRISKKALGCQVTLLEVWSWPPNLYLHDPYGTGIEYFHACFRRIDRVVEHLSRQIEGHRKHADG